MLYKQGKAWPTRRIHMFGKGDQISICGLIYWSACYAYREQLEWEAQHHLHPYDDLNFCQSCRRTATKAHGGKYVPLTTIYQDPGAKK